MRAVWGDSRAPNPSWCTSYSSSTCQIDQMVQMDLQTIDVSEIYFSLRIVRKNCQKVLAAIGITYWCYDSALSRFWGLHVFCPIFWGLHVFVHMHLYMDTYVVVNVIMYYRSKSMVCWYRFELSHCLWYRQGFDNYSLFTRLKGASSPRGVASFSNTETSRSGYVDLISGAYHLPTICFNCIHTAFAFQPRVWDTVWHA